MFGKLFSKRIKNSIEIIIEDERFDLKSYKHTNEQGENILFLRVGHKGTKKEKCTLFDSIGHWVDDDTWVRGISNQGKFEGIAKVTGTGLIIGSLREGVSGNIYFYEDIKNLLAIKSYCVDGTIDILNDERHYNY